MLNMENIFVYTSENYYWMNNMTRFYASPSQCRMARAHLNWSQEDVATRAGVNINTVSKFEKAEGQTASETVEKIAMVFELAGITMLPGGGVAPEGSVVTVLEGADANVRVMEDVYHGLKETGGEVLIAGLKEARPGDGERRTFVEDHIRRLIDAGITERVLLPYGDENLIAPAGWYRWLPEKAELGAPFQLYVDKIAMKDLGPPQRIVVIQHPLFAATMRGLFDLVWQTALPIGEPS